MPHDDEDRVFDVSKPSKVSAPPTSKPIIVGHHPQTADPMVNENRPHEPQPSHEAPVSSTGLVPSHVSIAVQDADHEPAPDPAPGQETPGTPLMDHHPLDAQPSENTDTKAAAVEPPADAKAPEEPQAAPMAAAGAAIYGQEPGAENSASPPQPAVVTPSANQTTPVPPADSGPPMDDLPLPSHHNGHNNHAPVSHQPKQKRDSGKMLWVLAILVLLVGAYAIADATTTLMPVHIFKKTTVTVTPPASSNTPSSSSTSQTQASGIPAGYKTYNLPATDISFYYLAAWGDPTTTADPGFSLRGGTNKSNGTYAYLVNFATNKDLQVAFTSPKYLPTARTALYYDFLQVCTGTNDGKFYKSILHFSTANGVDTPTTVTCDQGPLTDATKVNAATIIQQNTKAPDGSALGDLYTENLNDTAVAVVRVKDTAMTNGTGVKVMLASVKGSGNTGQ